MKRDSSVIFESYDERVIRIDLKIGLLAGTFWPTDFICAPSSGHSVGFADQAGRRVGQTGADLHIADSVAQRRLILSITGWNALPASSASFCRFISERAESRSPLATDCRCFLEIGEIADQPVVDPVAEAVLPGLCGGTLRDAGCSWPRRSFRR